MWFDDLVYSSRVVGQPGIGLCYELRVDSEKHFVLHYVLKEDVDNMVGDTVCAVWPVLLDKLRDIMLGRTP